jgi:hypothetical protein
MVTRSMAIFAGGPLSHIAKPILLTITRNRATHYFAADSVV